jgi:ABC-type Mn2+/Zn2+ transport system permease subunit
MISLMLLPLIVGIFVGAASGYLGSFMVLKRMSLVGDALSHVALPGIAIALMMGQPPILGAFIALTLAVIGIWYFQKTSNLYSDALVGIFFTTSLAIGVLITPEPDLLEALFGNIQKLTPLDAILAIIISVAIILLTRYISKKLMLGIISEELSQSLKISAGRNNLIYLLLVGTVVALGVKFVGTLLTGALVIIPAASAKNLSGSLSGYSLWSILIGIASSVLGVLVAALVHSPPGPVVILTSVAIFLLTYSYRFLRHN